MKDADTQPEGQPELAYFKRSAVLWAFWYAVVWGSFTVLVSFFDASEFPSALAVVLAIISGMLVIGLAFALRQGRNWAAWALAAFAVADMLGRISRHEGGFIIPLSMFLLSVNAGSSVRKYSAASQGDAAP